jgi:hypothetical protein
MSRYRIVLCYLMFLWAAVFYPQDYAAASDIDDPELTKGNMRMIRMASYLFGKLPHNPYTPCTPSANDIIKEAYATYQLNRKADGTYRMYPGACKELYLCAHQHKTATTEDQKVFFTLAFAVLHKAKSISSTTHESSAFFDETTFSIYLRRLDIQTATHLLRLIAGTLDEKEKIKNINSVLNLVGKFTKDFRLRWLQSLTDEQLSRFFSHEYRLKLEGINTLEVVPTDLRYDVFCAHINAVFSYCDKHSVYSQCCIFNQDTEIITKRMYKAISLFPRNLIPLAAIRLIEFHTRLDNDSTNDEIAFVDDGIKLTTILLKRMSEEERNLIIPSAYSCAYFEAFWPKSILRKYNLKYAERNIQDFIFDNLSSGRTNRAISFRQLDAEDVKLVRAFWLAEMSKEESPNMLVAAFILDQSKNLRFKKDDELILKAKELKGKQIDKKRRKIASKLSSKDSQIAVAAAERLRNQYSLYGITKQSSRTDPIFRQAVEVLRVFNKTPDGNYELSSGEESSSGDDCSSDDDPRPKAESPMQIKISSIYSVFQFSMEGEVNYGDDGDQ